ncbi:probable LRR receptor-like serine/threonine-protein kinase At4g20940 [Agrilus planipennis]|uniref:Probable LRR receptor-like serine/threonine-protein kinase At4g20940 n=1 Tax=Agrilus planipennis TaxID=224129 RepID=A0A1W4X5L8_AGRPL|nr:probable LRR receptor-like serine/threonine-protein kinase At4g20940 [Agrilus planipennis]
MDRHLSVIFVMSVGVLCVGQCFVLCAHHQRFLVEPILNSSYSVKCNNGNATACVHVNISDLGDSLGPLNVCHLSVRGITELSSFNFETLNRLQSLDLSRNAIATLANSNSSFNLESLKALDLSFNRIEVIEDAPFRTLPSLKVLNLGANMIDTVSVNAFVGLGELQSLDLSRNRLRAVSFHCFTPLRALQSLNFSRNSLSVADNSHFNDLQKLQQLDLSWNNLTRVDPGSMQFPNLLFLLLVGNPALGGSYELYLGPGKLLQNVDVSECGLARVPSALTQTIRILRLRHNSLKTISRGDFDSYPLIQVLDLSYNFLETIEEDAFGRLDLLRILYLTSNKLNHVPYSLPVELNTLHMEYNELKTIAKDEFAALGSLEVLLINDNNIETVELSAFSPLTSLITLDLSRNPISSLPAVLLSSMGKLQTLRLSNLDAYFDPDTTGLTILDHLAVLDISGSPKLAKQFLNNTVFLFSAGEIQKIDLRGTELTHVRNDLLALLPSLHTLLLQDNPLNCSDLYWLASWLRRQDSLENRMILCDSPLELKNVPLIDLQKIVNLSNSEPSKTKKLNRTKAKNKKTTQPNATLTDNKADVSIRNNCSHQQFAKKEPAANEVSYADNRTNLLSDKSASLEKCAEPAKLHKDKEETRSEETKGHAKALRDNSSPFTEQNANNLRQTAHDNLAAEIAPFTLMNSRKGVPGTQITPREWGKGSPEHDITPGFRRLNGDNSHAPDPSGATTKKDLSRPKYKINKQKLPQETQRVPNATNLIRNATKEETNGRNDSAKRLQENLSNGGHNKSADGMALAMTVEKRGIAEENIGFRGHVALLAFVFVIVNALVVIGTIVFRTRFYRNQRSSSRDEIEVTNLPGITDLW